MLKSLKWPGAVTCAKGGKFVGIYVGDGVKYGDCSYNPTEPPEVQADPQEQNENPEPQVYKKCSFYLESLKRELSVQQEASPEWLLKQARVI